MLVQCHDAFSAVEMSAGECDRLRMCISADWADIIPVQAMDFEAERMEPELEPASEIKACEVVALGVASAFILESPRHCEDAEWNDRDHESGDVVACEVRGHVVSSYLA